MVVIESSASAASLGELHWQPRFTKGEAAFRSFVKLSAEEPVASRASARKFIFVLIWLARLVGFGVDGVE